MQLGANIPVTDIGTGPAPIRDFAQAAEGLGYDFLVGPDHVLGADPAKIAPGGPRMGSNASAYHDPFVLFGFLSGVTKKIELRRRRADPGAAPGGAGRQAGGLPRRAERQPLSPRRRRRLEPDRIPGTGLRLPHARQTLGGAGPLHAGAVGQPHDHLQGQVPRADRRRHQPAAEVGQGAGMVRRPCRADPRARREVRRRLHSQPLAAGRRGDGGVHQSCAA
jgi:hypothetical protein